MNEEERVLTKAADRWIKGRRTTRPLMKYRHKCNPELPEGAHSIVVFLDDMSLFWNVLTMPEMPLIDAKGDWLCLVAIFDGALYAEAPYCESQCDEEGRGKLQRDRVKLLEMARREK